mmetsp:Transcript_55499/g.172571  ORF Transcript_55499/g.172571 Transcript_55499/m.172571 type:complete len:271 (-) Transcript_55499:604-1416(-)
MGEFVLCTADTPVVSGLLPGTPVALLPCPASPRPLSCRWRLLVPLVVREATAATLAPEEPWPLVMTSDEPMPVGELPPSEPFAVFVGVGWLYCPLRAPKLTTGSWFTVLGFRAALPPRAMLRKLGRARGTAGGVTVVVPLSAASGCRGVANCRALASSRWPRVPKGDACLGAWCCCCLKPSADALVPGPGEGLSDLEIGVIFQDGACPRLGALTEALVAAVGTTALPFGWGLRKRPARPPSGLRAALVRPFVAARAPSGLRATLLRPFAA